jgi:hypothetical protein
LVKSLVFGRLLFFLMGALFKNDVKMSVKERSNKLRISVCKFRLSHARVRDVFRFCGRSSWPTYASTSQQFHRICGPLLAAAANGLSRHRRVVEPLVVCERRVGARVIGNRAVVARGRAGFLEPVSDCFLPPNTKKVQDYDYDYEERPLPQVAPPVAIAGFQRLVFSGYIGEEALSFVEVFVSHICNQKNNNM